MFPSVKGATNQGHSNAQIINLRCPHCHHHGAFGGFPDVMDVVWKVPVLNRAGIRVCANANCRGIVFIWTQQDVLFAAFPPELVGYDETDLPAEVRDCLKEAILCHAQGCFRAAAIMVRRSLEAMCEERGAKGSSLEKKIESLKGQIVISQDLIEGAHELRFLGNDAAHVEAKAFTTVGKEEVEAALDLAKELLRATYQTAALVKRLRAMKTPLSGQGTS